MVSVIIPVYNVEKYIDKCIMSVLNQSYSDFEIILIDDGSTDNSSEKCELWEKVDSRIKFVKKKNEGLGPTRNLGVNLSRNKYVTFLDSDDWWHTDYLKEMMMPFIKYDVDISCCDIYYYEECADGSVSSNVSLLRIKSGSVCDVDADREIINTARTFMWGKIYKKSLFVENEVIQPSHAFEDVPITPLIIAKAKNIYRVNIPLYYYRRKREGSLANRSDLLLDMKLSIGELISNFKKADLYCIYKNQLKKMIYSQARFIIKKAENLCDAVRKKEIEEVFWKAIVDEFPELSKMKKLFLIKDNENLKKLMGLIVMNQNQIVIDENEYEIYEGNNERYVRVELDNLGIMMEDMSETQLWNMADRIFYEIVNEGD